MIGTTQLGCFIVNLGRLAKIPQGEGRVFQTLLGHDVKALSDPNYQMWMCRCVESAARGSVAKD